MFEFNKDLTAYNTFGLKTEAAIFAEYSNVAQLRKIIASEEFKTNPVLHIGGGSNLVMRPNFNGLILNSKIKGITPYRKDDETVFVIAGAGEKWSDLVDYCVENGYAGLENLADIPGEVGAAPVQNVGAYGVEAGALIHKVECLDARSGEKVVLSQEEFGFAYRDSNLKKKWKGRYFVLRVSFKLKLTEKASNLTYGALSQLKNKLKREPMLRDVRDEVSRLRASKLPSVELIGSAGSYFKNPVMRRKYYEYEVLNLNPDVPHYDVDEDHVKVPAGWLIEHAGLKGRSVGGAYVYPDNCLVIANRGDATAEDVLTLADEIMREVNRQFHIHLEPEANLIDSTVKVAVLGSGTSKGVPELGCDCSVCSSENPLDRRLRASILVETMGVTFLIDPGPDFRYQAIRAGIRHIDAILITHEHYDHVGGIDDLRPFCFNAPLKMYMKADVEEKLRRRLDYCFSDSHYPGVPQFDIHRVNPGEPFYIKGVKIEPIEVFHGKLPILGYRIGKFAYITDAKYIEPTEICKLEGLDVLMVNALRERDHFAHFTIKEALSLVENVDPKETYLTHLCHEVGHHEQFDASLPANVHPAFDGQIIKIP